MPARKLDHPIDAAIRARLLDLELNQDEAAQTCGRSAGWYNKYIHGKGHATIDDIIRLAAWVIGADAPVLSAAERRLVLALRSISADEHDEDRRLDAVAIFESHARTLQRTPSRRSAATRARMPKGTKNTGHGKS